VLPVDLVQVGIDGFATEHGDRFPFHWEFPDRLLDVGANRKGGVAAFKPVGVVVSPKPCACIERPFDCEGFQ